MASRVHQWIRLGLWSAVVIAGITAGAWAGEPFIDDGAEPPTNAYLADSPWPMSHRNPYNQASSPYPGPDGGETFSIDHSVGGVGPISINFSGPDYAGGQSAIWGANFFDVFKIIPQAGGGRVVRRFPDFPVGNLISGAYTVLDADENFFVPKGTQIRRYGELFASDPNSQIWPLANYYLPAEALGAGDSIVGLNLTYDGWLVLATAKGTVAVLARDFSEIRYVFLDTEPGEEVTNSIAVDEDGGIYVVTSQSVYRVQWDGISLSTDPADGAWSAPYEPGPSVPAPGRLGTGSGTTPTLMGTGDDDKFVVIADGQELMHIVLYWRDEIPVDWVPLPGKDPRIAAEMPITFGDPAATRSITEQSITVRGYDAMVVSNTYRNWPFSGGLFGLLVTFFSGNPLYQPFGVEKFQWDPVTRTLATAWANPDLSCPNGIPSMSAATGLAYCYGARGGQWTVEGIDWATGAEVFHVFTGSTSFNSLYAATEIGPGGSIASGTVGGPLFLTPQ
ncbi:MAG: hypothetical protein KC466_01485 [Myxococcales bacterium]|nr:hypothetical protein [Myxococcales bacterium]